MEYYNRKYNNSKLDSMNRENTMAIPKIKSDMYNAKPRPVLGEIGNCFNLIKMSGVKLSEERTRGLPQSDLCGKQATATVPQQTEVIVTQFEKGIENIDEDTERNVFLLGQYVNHVYSYLLGLEERKVNTPFIFYCGQKPNF